MSYNPDGGGGGHRQFKRPSPVRNPGQDPNDPIESSSSPEVRRSSANPNINRPQQAGPPNPNINRPQQPGPPNPNINRPQQAGPANPNTNRPQQPGPRYPNINRPQQQGPQHGMNTDALSMQRYHQPSDNPGAQSSNPPQHQPQLSMNPGAQSFNPPHNLSQLSMDPGAQSFNPPRNPQPSMNLGAQAFNPPRRSQRNLQASTNPNTPSFNPPPNPQQSMNPDASLNVSRQTRRSAVTSQNLGSIPERSTLGSTSGSSVAGPARSAVPQPSSNSQRPPGYRPRESSYPPLPLNLPQVGLEFAPGDRIFPQPLKQWGGKEIWTCDVTTNYHSVGTISLMEVDSKVQELQEGCNTMNVFVNQHGYSYGEPRVDMAGRRFRRFQLAWTDENAWVPEDCLKPGKVATGAKFVVEPYTGPRLLDNPNITVLEKTIDGLLHSISENKSRLVDIGVDSNTLTSLSENIDFYRHSMMQSIQPQVLEVIKDGGYHFDALFNLPNHLDLTNRRWIGKKVIYAILMQGLDGDHTKNAIYHGKSENGYRRQKDHAESWDPASTRKGQLYKIARTATKIRMICWADLEHVPKDHFKNILQATEFVSVALDMSWNPALRDAVLSDKWMFDRLTCGEFSTLALATFRASGWQPITGCHGSNWCTPLADWVTKFSTWIRNTVPLRNGHHISVYRRAPIRVGGTRHQTLTLMSQGTYLVDISITSNALPAASTLVYPIVEIYKGKNQRHPNAYANVPEPGPWSDWDCVNRIGIRVEWMGPEGKWINTWVFASHDITTGYQYTKGPLSDQHKKFLEHTPVIYLKMLRIFNTLENIRYHDTPDLPPWLKGGPEYHIKDVVYDHLNETLSVREVPVTYKSMPTMRSFKENTDWLMQNFHDRYKGHIFFGTPPDVAGPLNTIGTWQNYKQKLKHCAFCHGSNSSDVTECPSKPAVSQGSVQELRMASCKRCFLWRRCCVFFIPQDDMYKIPEISRTLTFQRVRDPTRYVIRGPPPTFGPTSEEEPRNDPEEDDEDGEVEDEGED